MENIGLEHRVGGEGKWLRAGSVDKENEESRSVHFII